MEWNGRVERNGGSSRFGPPILLYIDVAQKPISWILTFRYHSTIPFHYSSLVQQPKLSHGYGCDEMSVEQVVLPQKCWDIEASTQAPKTKLWVEVMHLVRSRKVIWAPLIPLPIILTLGLVHPLPWSRRGNHYVFVTCFWLYNDYLLKTTPKSHSLQGLNFISYLL